MDRVDFAHALQLHNNFTADEKVHSLSAKLDPVISHADRRLPHEWNIPLPELVCQRVFINPFYEPWPERSMDANGATDDLLCQLIQRDRRSLILPHSSLFSASSANLKFWSELCALCGCTPLRPQQLSGFAQRSARSAVAIERPDRLSATRPSQHLR